MLVGYELREVQRKADAKVESNGREIAKVGVSAPRKEEDVD